MWFLHLPKTLNQLRRTWQSDIPSLEYQRWRHRLILERLPIAILLVAIAIAIFVSITFAIVLPAIQASGDPRLIPREGDIVNYIGLSVAEELGLLLCWLLLRDARMRQRPELLFLLFSWSVSFLSQMQSLMQGKIYLDITAWLLLFPAQAIIVPVRWEMHLASQAGVLGYFLCGYLLGLRDPKVIYEVSYLISGFYAIMVCFVADLGVYLYDRSLRNQFELRASLRVFLHAVSHDLRNPVLGMNMVLRGYLEPEGKDARIPQEILEQMITSGDRQLELINLLLESHDTEVSGIVLHRQPLDLDALLRSLLAEQQPFLEQVRATAIVSLPDDLPPLHADSLQLRRVYENLLANALRHNRPGLEVWLNAQREGDRVRCAVSDNGVGMTYQQCDKIFELYARGPNARQSIGLGLGLYICQQIVRAHGGDIGVISSPGQGATFWFTLPIAS